MEEWKKHGRPGVNERITESKIKELQQILQLATAEDVKKYCTEEHHFWRKVTGKAASHVPSPVHM